LVKVAARHWAHNVNKRSIIVYYITSRGELRMPFYYPFSTSTT